MKKLSEDAYSVFITADLFGDGGKVYNAGFAAQILETAAHIISSQEDRNKLTSISNELRSLAE